MVKTHLSGIHKTWTHNCASHKSHHIFDPAPPPLKTTIVAKYQNNAQVPYQWLNNPIVVKATKVLKYYKKMLLSMVFSNEPQLNSELWLNYGWTFEIVR